MIGIYKITSLTNKVYIGQSVNIFKRKNSYKKCNKNTIGYKIYNSINKHGWENHKHEIIEECTIEQLNEKETYYKQIELDKVQGDWSKVLFCELHDKGGGVKSKETKYKQSQGLLKIYSTKQRLPYWSGKKRDEHSNIMKGKNNLKYTRTTEHKNILSENIKKMWDVNREEICKKIKKGKIGKGMKSVKCNETEKIYNSIKECSEDTGISKGIICSFVKGTYRYPSIRGFTFSYN
jgi:group I intron endonuclease